MIKPLPEYNEFLKRKNVLIIKSAVKKHGQYPLTSNFFVKKAEIGEIKINKENSKVIQKNPTTTDLFFEVENVGETTEILDRFYLNEDVVENEILPSQIEYLSGSVILNPGEKTNIHISNVATNFYPIRTFNIIGVATPNEAFF